MSQKESELTQGSDEILDDSEIPIIILPDDVLLQDVLPDAVLPGDVDLAREETPTSGRQEGEARAPAAPPAPPTKQPAGARGVARKAVQTHTTTPRVERRTAHGKVVAEEVEPLFNVEELELQIEEELDPSQTGGRRVFSMPWACRLAAGAAVSLLMLLLYVGWEYYAASLLLRPLHRLHDLLRPSGTLGLALGGLAVLAMASTLIYLWRKHSSGMQKVGKVQNWLGFHVLVGVLGPALALFHAGFVPTSALGLLATVSMVFVVGSGVIGRYLAVYFPRSLTGHELRFEEIRGRLGIYKRKLADLGVDPTLLRIEIPQERSKTPLLVTSVIRVIAGDRESRREYRRLKEAIALKGSLHIQTELVLFLIKRLCRERQWLVRHAEFRRLIGAWRFVHCWLAVALFVAVAFHVAVAVRYGNLWILGGAR